MPTPHGPGQRRAAADALFARAESVNTTPVKARYTRFEKAHRTFVALDDKADAAAAKLREAQKAAGEADAALDETLDPLARALIADGHPRTSPFKPFGAPAPSTLASLGYQAEAEAVTKLVKAIRKHKGSSKATLAAAAASEKAAAVVLAKIAPIKGLAAAWSERVTARGPAELEWEAAYAALRRGAKAAEDEGAKGLHAALFGDGAPSKPSKKKKPAPVEPAK